MLFWQRHQALAAAVITDAFKGLRGNMGNSTSEVRAFVRQLVAQYEGKAVDLAVVQAVDQAVRTFVEGHGQEGQTKHPTRNLPPTAEQNLELLVEALRAKADESREDIPSVISISVPRLIERLNDPTAHSLIVIQSHDPDELRSFAAMLADFIYESRRKTGRIAPLVSFIFDEADEFIPGQASGDSQKETKRVAMMLARRGRKFGLGIGIATQRIANLDTNTLAQPHTYFVSKLPRQYDRQTIAGAFGIAEDMFRQTFKFKKGDWLLASYDAAGLEAIPIPIHAANADDAILRFAEKQRAVASPPATEVATEAKRPVQVR